MMTTGDNVSALAEAERSLYRAMIAKDFTVLEESLAADLCYSTPPAWPRRATNICGAWPTASTTMRWIASSDVRIRAVDHLGVMNGIVTMSVGKRGMPKDTLDLLFVLVWVKKPDRWRLAIRQATRMSLSP